MLSDLHVCPNIWNLYSILIISINVSVPDAIVLNLLKDRLCQVDCATRGWVLTGYPLTREQAEQLTGAGLGPNR